MLSCYIVIYTKALLKYCFYLHFYLDRRNEEDKLREEVCITIITDHNHNCNINQSIAPIF
jgi:hypothetical protein